jgi:hypothetical protein
MAEDVTAATAVQPEIGKRERRTEQARRTSYRTRFSVVYVLLAAIVGAGIGAFVVLATRADPPRAESWSEWQPNGSRTAMLRQIADRIPKAYKENGKQLVLSIASPLAVSTGEGELPVETVFVQPDTSRGLAEEDDIDAYDGSKVASFGLCGIGADEQCAITTGKPSTARYTLLRRQALELSLYTFKYVDDVDSVVVFMPPTTKGQSNGTVFLTRDDVAEELRRPIREILPSRTPRLGGLSELEQGHILRLTAPRTYAFEFRAAPDGRPILVLTPPSAVPTS